MLGRLYGYASHASALALLRIDLIEKCVGVVRKIPCRDSGFGLIKRMAQRFYSRAVGEDPTNPLYLKSLEECVLAMVPDTAAEARELYQTYVSVLKHDAAHHRYRPHKGAAQNL